MADGTASIRLPAVQAPRVFLVGIVWADGLKPGQPVKRVIRSRKAGLYLNDDGTWTADWQKAKGFDAFKGVWAAKHFREVDLVLVVGDKPSAQDDIILPMPGAFQPPALDFRRSLPGL